MERIPYGLIVEAKRGDESALGAIVCRYEKWIAMVAKRMETCLRLSKEEAMTTRIEDAIKQDLLLKILYEYDEDCPRMMHWRG